MKLPSPSPVYPHHPDVQSNAFNLSSSTAKNGFESIPVDGTMQCGSNGHIIIVMQSCNSEKSECQQQSTAAADHTQTMKTRALLMESAQYVQIAFRV